jgi:hypothetical protein
MKPAPFQLTEEAEKMIRHMLASTKEDMEPALNWSPLLGRASKEGEYLGTYEGLMVVLGHYRKNDRPRDSFFEVCGQPVSILPETLERVVGMTIACEQVELRGGDIPHHAYVFKVG